MTLEKTQYTAKLRATHENVLSRTRRGFLAAPAVGGSGAAAQLGMDEWSSSIA
jgi:hypothetical protein